METCRFDNWTRMFGALRSRRAALAEIAAAGGTLFALARLDLGLAAESDVAIEDCRLTDAECTRKSQCCSEICSGFQKDKRDRKGGGKNNRNNRREKRVGTCRCRRGGQSCTRSSACCKGWCDPNSLICSCVPNGGLCNDNEDCCSPRQCRDDGSGSNRKVCAR
jgi:hypothetical protein